MKKKKTKGLSSAAAVLVAAVLAVAGKIKITMENLNSSKLSSVKGGLIIAPWLYVYDYFFGEEECTSYSSGCGVVGGGGGTGGW